MQWPVRGHSKSFPERLRGQLSDSGWERCPAAGMATSPQDRAETRSVDLWVPRSCPRSVWASDVRPCWPGAGFGDRPGRFGLRPRCSRDATVTGGGGRGVNDPAFFHGHGRGARRNAGVWPPNERRRRSEARLRCTHRSRDLPRRGVFPITPCLSTTDSPRSSRSLDGRYPFVILSTALSRSHQWRSL
jgi:hypothetical protein